MAWQKLSPELQDIISQLKGSLSGSTENKFVTKKTFSPSKLVWNEGGCPRFWNFMFTGVETETVYDFVSLRNMKSGVASHEHKQEIIEKNSGLDLVIEQELLSEDPPIRSFADIVITTSDGEKIPVEIKTTRTESYEVRDRTFTGAPYNILQLLVYMKILGSTRGFLLYENRNSFENIVIPVFMTKENEELIDSVFEWMRQTRKAWEDGTMPKYFAGRRSNSKMCKTCPIKKSCDAAGEGVVDIPLLSKFVKE